MRRSHFESLDTSIVEIEPSGQLALRRPGDTYVLTHYAGKIGYIAALAPGKRSAELPFPNESLADPVDRLVVDKLRRLNIVPAGACNDNDFVRRAYLDVIGQLPTPDEVRRFVADASPDKRPRLIDQLLVHPRHAGVWAMKKCDAMGADNRTMYDGPGDNPTIERAIDYPLSRPRGDDSYVLKIFDKPQRTQSCDCERSGAPNLSQALYLYNDEALTTKIADPNGRLTRLLKEMSDDDRLLEELYLLTLSRLPTAAERQRSAQHLKAAPSRKDGFEDLLWSLLNRQEFLITH